MKKLEIDQMSVVAGGGWTDIACAALRVTAPYWLWASLCSSHFTPIVG